MKLILKWRKMVSFHPQGFETVGIDVKDMVKPMPSAFASTKET